MSVALAGLVPLGRVPFPDSPVWRRITTSNVEFLKSNALFVLFGSVLGTNCCLFRSFAGWSPWTEQERIATVGSISSLYKFRSSKTVLLQASSPVASWYKAYMEGVQLASVLPSNITCGSTPYALNIGGEVYVCTEVRTQDVRSSLHGKGQRADTEKGS